MLFESVGCTLFLAIPIQTLALSLSLSWTRDRFSLFLAQTLSLAQLCDPTFSLLVFFYSLSFQTPWSTYEISVIPTSLLSLLILLLLLCSIFPILLLTVLPLLFLFYFAFSCLLSFPVSFLLTFSLLHLFVFTTSLFLALVFIVFHTLLDILSFLPLLSFNWFLNYAGLAMIWPKLLPTSVLQFLFSLYISCSTDLPPQYFWLASSY